MNHELERTFDSEAKKRELYLTPDTILDIELKHALKIYNLKEGLDEKDATLLAGKTLNKFRVFLNINFKNKYCRKGSWDGRQKPGSDFVVWCFKPGLHDLLLNVKSVEQLKAKGFEEVEFNNIELAAIKECFLELSPVVTKK